MEKSLSYKKQNLSTTPLNQSQTVVSIGNIYQFIIIINSWPFCVCVWGGGGGGGFKHVNSLKACLHDQSFL